MDRFPATRPPTPDSSPGRGLRWRRRRRRSCAAVSRTCWRTPSASPRCARPPDGLPGRTLRGSSSWISPASRSRPIPPGGHHSRPRLRRDARRCVMSDLLRIGLGAVAVALAGAAGYTVGAYAVTEGLSVGVVKRGPVRPMVALTFDDGPDPEYTPRILDALAEAGVHASFFMVGSRAEAAAPVARA